MSHRSKPARTGLAFETLEDRRHLSLTVKVDYTYDTSGFFASQARRDVLQAAVNSVAGQIKDAFAAVTPTAANGWDVSFDNPSGTNSVVLKNPTVEADTLLLYVGAESMSGGALANANPVGYSTSSSDAAWLDTLRTRGRPRGADGTVATPIIGRMAFNPNYDWYAGLSASGLTSSQYDLYSVATHELGHVLGIGASAAWSGKIVNHLFTGPASTGVYGAAVPTETAPTSNAHLEPRVSSDGQTVLFQPYTSAGRRNTLTRLDLAVLKDLGYDVTVPPKPQQYGSLTGYAIYDANNSRTKDSGEAGFGAIMYLDANANGTLDDGELTAQTAADGKFNFTGVPVGEYRLGQYDPTGAYTLTQPTGAYQKVVIGPNAKTGPVLFFNTKGASAAASISGQVYGDNNGNGIQDVAERPYTGTAVTPYLDLNQNNALDANEPTATLDVGGIYTFNGLAPGIAYTVRLAGLGVSLGQTQPAAGGRTVTAVAGQNLGVAPFGVFKTTVVHGYVYDDANGNKAVDPGEAAVAGRVIYADYNLNGKRDANEPAAATDANGYYALPLQPGDYTLRQLLPDSISNGGYVTNDPNGSAFRYYGQISVSADSSAYDYTFLSRNGGSVTVYAFDDTNGNGSFDSDEKLSTSAHLVYVDRNPNNVLDADDLTGYTVGGVTFKLASGGSYVVHIVPKGDAVASPDVQTVTIYSDVNSTLYFAIKPGTPPTPPTGTATVRGYVVSDANANAKWDTGENAVAGRTVYLDLNNNGSLDAGDVSQVTDGKGYYAFKNLTAGTYAVREVLPSGSVQVSPKNNGALSIGISAGQTRDAIFYVTAGSTPPVDPPTPPVPTGTSTVRGYVVNDANQNAKWDSGESAVAGRTVFLDANNNGTLDAGEASLVTDAKGYYAFKNIAAGTYAVREILPAGSVQVSPKNNAALSIGISAGQTRDAIFYVTAGSTPVDPPTPPVPAGTASVAGKIYPSGSAADKAAALKLGWRAFLDSDNDGQLDAGETGVALDSAGQFTISGLKAGTYTLRLVPPAGWAVSSPTTKAFTFTLKDGQAKTGQNFTVVRG